MARVPIQQAITNTAVVGGSTLLALDPLTTFAVYSDAAHSSYATVYADATTGATLANPVTSAAGLVPGWLADGQTYYWQAGSQSGTIEAVSASRVQYYASGLVLDARSLTDLATTASSATVTSASAPFLPTDVGKSLVSMQGGSPVVRSITGYTSATTVSVSPAPTGTASGVKAIVGTDNTAALNAAGGVAGTVLAAGSYLITATVTMQQNADWSLGSLLTLHPLWPAVEVRTGSGATIIQNKRLLTPEIQQLNQTWVAGAITAGTNGLAQAAIPDLGLRVTNAFHLELHIGHIVGFGCGMQEYAVSGALHAYGNYFFSRLDHNKINLWLTTDNNTAGASHDGAGGSATNENNHYGGRFSHNTLSTRAAGTRHIFIDATTNISNNHRFYGISVEGQTCEYNLDCYGSYDYFYALRWETTPPNIHWGALAITAADATTRSISAVRNRIMDGYNLQNAVETLDTGVVTSDNSVMHTNYARQSFPGFGHVILGSGAGGTAAGVEFRRIDNTAGDFFASTRNGTNGVQSWRWGQDSSDNWTLTSPTGVILLQGSRTANLLTVGAGQVGLPQITLGTSGTVYRRVLSATLSWTPGAVANGAVVSTTLAVTNAAVGDVVSVGSPNLAVGLVCTGYVSAAGTVTLVIANHSGGTLTPASGTYRAMVSQF